MLFGAKMVLCALASLFLLGPLQVQDLVTPLNTSYVNMEFSLEPIIETTNED
jgi:hypothetical protein